MNYWLHCLACNTVAHFISVLFAFCFAEPELRLVLNIVLSLTYRIPRMPKEQIIATSTHMAC
jgi:hypothetical protein